MWQKGILFVALISTFGIFDVLGQGFGNFGRREGGVPERGGMFPSNGGFGNREFGNVPQNGNFGGFPQNSGQFPSSGSFRGFPPNSGAFPQNSASGGFRPPRFPGRF